MVKATISIIMPIHNEREYVIQSVESVLNQSEKNFELIIVDDGSTDGCVELLKEKINDSRLRIIQPGKVGKNQAFNLGFNLSTGSWIVYFAGDDIMPPDSLKNRMEYVKNTNPLGAKTCCFGQLEMISDTKRYNGVKVPKHPNKGTKSGGTLMISRKLAEIIFPIPVDLGNEDKWTVLHCDYFAENLIHVPKLVLYYRIHNQNSISYSSDFSEKNENMHARFKVYELFKNKYEDVLEKSHKINLTNLAKAENYRYRGKMFSIIFLSNLSVTRKIRFIMYSNRFLYATRNRFFNLFSGWGG